MFGAILYGKDDVRFEQREDPRILEPTDAIVRTVATCVCGSDLWRYRGIAATPEPHAMGHEFVGIVEEVGADVRTMRPGEFVIGGFQWSCGNCPVCEVGQQANCPNGGDYDGCQAEFIRIPQADGTLVATPEVPTDKPLIAGLLTLSDVMGTGWHAAVCADVRPGGTTVVVGDGAVGLCGVIAARELGAERVIAMSRYPERQRLARDFGATHIVAERGDDGVTAVMELTGGVGADSVLECVGTDASVDQALRCARIGGQVGWVGLPHVERINQAHMFWRNVGLRGGLAPAREYLPTLLPRVLDGAIEPGRVFDVRLPLREVAKGYAAMHERRAIKVLLDPTL